LKAGTAPKLHLKGHSTVPEPYLLNTKIRMLFFRCLL